MDRPPQGIASDEVMAGMRAMWERLREAYIDVQESGVRVGMALTHDGIYELESLSIIAPEQLMGDYRVVRPPTEEMRYAKWLRDHDMFNSHSAFSGTWNEKLVMVIGDVSSHALRGHVWHQTGGPSWKDYSVPVVQEPLRKVSPGYSGGGMAMMDVYRAEIQQMSIDIKDLEKTLKTPKRNPAYFGTSRPRRKW